MPWPVFADTCTNMFVAAPFLGDDFVLGELGAHAIRIGIGLVDLVHRDDDRHAGRLRVLDCFDGLRHDAVVGRDHEHHDVRGLGAARTHGGERRVARRIEERDHALRRFHVVRADVLRDAARLTRRHLRACGCSRAARSCRDRRDP